MSTFLQFLSPSHKLVPVKCHKLILSLVDCNQHCKYKHDQRKAQQDRNDSKSIRSGSESYAGAVFYENRPEATFEKRLCFNENPYRLSETLRLWSGMCERVSFTDWLHGFMQPAQLVSQHHRANDADNALGVRCVGLERHSRCWPLASFSVSCFGLLANLNNRKNSGRWPLLAVNECLSELRDCIRLFCSGIQTMWREWFLSTPDTYKFTSVLWQNLSVEEHEAHFSHSPVEGTFWHTSAKVPIHQRQTGYVLYLCQKRFRPEVFWKDSKFLTELLNGLTFD